MNQIQKEFLLHGYDFECVESEFYTLLFNSGYYLFLREPYGHYPYNTVFRPIDQLVISGENISDISFLNTVPSDKIKKIDFSGNSIKSIGVLKELNLENLRILYLDHNNIKNISVISNLFLPNLEILNLQMNDIQDFSPLLDARFPKLAYLTILSSSRKERNISNAEIMHQLKEKFQKVKSLTRFR